MTNPATIRRFVVGGAVLWALALAAAVPILLERGSVARDPGWKYSSPGDVPRVTRVTPGGAAAGLLKVGDRILSIDGETRYAGLYGPDWQIWRYPPGTHYRVRLARRGEVHEVALRIGSRRASQWPIIWSFLFGSVTFASIAWLIGWQRPDLLTARVGWLASQVTAFVYISLALGITQSQGWYPGVLLATLRLAADWHFWLTFWFVAEFPFSPPPSRLWRGVRIGLAVLCAIGWILVSVFQLPFIGSPSSFARLPPWWATAANTGQTFYEMAVAACLVAVLIRNYRVIADPAGRRRIEIVAGAIAFALGVIGVSSVLSWMQQRPLPPAANLAPLPIPLCFAYAVTRHRVLDLRLAMRRSLQYLLARQLLRVLTLLPLGLLVIRVIADPGAPIGSLINIAGVTLVVAAALAWSSASASGERSTAGSSAKPSTARSACARYSPRSPGWNPGTTWWIPCPADWWRSSRWNRPGSPATTRCCWGRRNPKNPTRRPNRSCWILWPARSAWSAANYWAPPTNPPPSNPSAGESHARSTIPQATASPAFRCTWKRRARP